MMLSRPSSAVTDKAGTLTLDMVTLPTFWALTNFQVGSLDTGRETICLSTLIASFRPTVWS